MKQAPKIKNLRYVDTAGGPFIFITSEDAPKWQGVRSDHYDKACNIYDEVANLSLHDVKAIILGTEHYSTACVYYDDGAILIRWIVGESKASMEEKLNHRDSIFRSSTPVVRFRTGPSGCMHLFDSGAPGSEPEALSEGLTIKLGKSTEYAISTETIQLDKQHEVLINNIFRV